MTGDAEDAKLVLSDKARNELAGDTEQDVVEPASDNLDDQRDPTEPEDIPIPIDTPYVNRFGRKTTSGKRNIHD